MLSTQPKVVSDCEFNAMLKELHPTIDWIIRTSIFNYNSSDMCHDYDDVYQLALDALWNSYKIYDPNRGKMKFRTFAIDHIKSRLGNFRNKVVRKNKQKTSCMSQLNNGHSLNGEGDDNERTADGTGFCSLYEDYVEALKGGEEAMNQILDAKRVLERLTGNRKKIFVEYYIKGKRINEIVDENPDMKYQQVRRHKEYVDNIYKTLVLGDTRCLQ